MPMARVVMSATARHQLWQWCNSEGSGNYDGKGVSYGNYNGNNDGSNGVDEGDGDGDSDN